MMGLVDSSTRFDVLVTSIYDAALDTTRWDAALGLICKELDAAAAGISHQSFETGLYWQTWHNLDPEFERSYVSHYWSMDPWMPHATRLQPGEALYSESALPHQDLQRTAFYNELCRPFDMQDLVGGLLERNDQEMVTFGVMRRTHPSSFEDRDARFLERLIPHLRRAYAVQERLMGAERAERTSWSAIETLPMAVFLLDERGNIARTNSAADHLLATSDALTSEGTRLKGVSPVAERAIRSLLFGKAGGPASIIERDGKRPLVATALPISGRVEQLDMEGRGVLVVVVDPEQQIAPPTEVLERLFALTRAEARVALLVGGGLSPKEAAQSIGSTWNTVRAQLKQVFAKTGTNGQPALVRLLSKLELLPPNR